jgi:hypothetical protein
VKGKAKYGSYTLWGVRADDGKHIRLGSLTSSADAHDKATFMIRSTSMWREIQIHDRWGNVYKRITKGAHR